MTSNERRLFIPQSYRGMLDTGCSALKEQMERERICVRIDREQGMEFSIKFLF